MTKTIVISASLSHQTLLKTLEQQAIELYRECCQGHCGSCKSRLVSGEVFYKELPLTPLDDDECLPCCAYPASEVILEIK
jgi:ferredoxin